ncbi:MAG: TIGR00304 family membrane protein [Sulfolobales archaeon]|jgi:uncharacterized protein (TIGR00304 family)
MYEYITILLGLIMILVGVLLVTLSIIRKRDVYEEIISHEKERSGNERSESVGIIVIGPFPIIIRSSSVKLFIVLSLIFIIIIFLVMILITLRVIA